MAASDPSLSLLDLVESNPHLILHMDKIAKYREAKANLKSKTEMRTQLKVYWVYGPPGSGKTFGVWNMVSEKRNPAATALEEGAPAMSLYRLEKNASTLWWDHYEGEEVVIFDDFRKEWMPYDTFLRWTDVYPTRISRKGREGTHLAAIEIWITAVTPPKLSFGFMDGQGRLEDVRQRADVNDLGQVRRRIAKIWKVTAVGEPWVEVDWDGEPVNGDAIPTQAVVEWGGYAAPHQ